jgi:hypothetical protein
MPEFAIQTADDGFAATRPFHYPAIASFEREEPRMIDASAIIPSGMCVAAFVLALSSNPWSHPVPAIAMSRNLQPPLLLDASAAQITAILASELNHYAVLPDGWDGPMSLAPSADTIREAKAFLPLILSFGLRLPEASASADGEIDLYWKTGNAFIDANFRGNRTLTYFARIDGQVAARGIAHYDGRTIPQDLLNAIRSI